MAKNTKEKKQSNQWTIISLVLTIFVAITISTYCFFSGWFIVHQNLFYIPIIISCMFFGKKGFVFSAILSLVYFSLNLYFTNDFIIISQALTRCFVFVVIAGIITFLSTKQKRIEDKLRLVSAQLQNVINSSSQVSIISTDISGRIITFNSGAEHMLGYSSQEMMGKTPVFYHLESEITERGRELTKELGYPVEGFEVLVAYAKKGSPETREWTYVRKDGGHIIVNIAVTPVQNDAGQIIGFTGVASNITERKKMEEELRESKLKFKTIFDSARDAVMLLTPERGFFEANPSTIEIFGCKDKSELTKKSPADLSPPYQPDGKLSAVKANEMMSIAMEKGSHFFEWVHKRIDGQEFFADVLLTKMKWENKMVLQANVRDITKRKKAEGQLEAMTQDLQKKTKLLELSNKELEAFSYSVSHDLRAPLRSIDGFSKAIMEDYSDKLDEQGRNYLGRVCTACQQMAQLIEDMLMLSKINRSEMRYKQLNLSDLVQSIANEFMQNEPQRKVEFIIAPSVIVNGDKQLLNIMLHNLLGNAWKFTSKHPSAKIEFGTIKNEETPVYFVADDGAGFDMKYADKLFGAFQRLHTMEEFEGTGIGLAIVQRIISRHGGKVWAKGDVEKGASFYFSLG